MDQTLSLRDPSAAAIRPVDANPTTAPGGTATPGAGTDEEPDSPGRSLRADAPNTSTDPLAEGLALLAGVAIALFAVMVPLATVICDPRVVAPAESSR